MIQQSKSTKFVPWNEVITFHKMGREYRCGFVMTTDFLNYCYKYGNHVWLFHYDRKNLTSLSNWEKKSFMRRRMSDIVYANIMIDKEDRLDFGIYHPYDKLNEHYDKIFKGFISYDQIVEMNHVFHNQLRYDSHYKRLNPFMKSIKKFYG